MAVLWCHMEYSIWLFYDDIWSTPFGKNLRTHGVLHNVVNCLLLKKYKELHKAYFCSPMEYSMWSLFHATWSNPYGRFLVTYGVL